MESHFSVYYTSYLLKYLVTEHEADGFVMAGF
jgi:hypothetical protein